MAILCAICREIFNHLDSGRIIALLCGHIFHAHCITAWMGINQTCPQCRTLASLNESLKIFLEVQDASDDIETLKTQLETVEFAKKMRETDNVKLRSQLTDQNRVLAELRDEVSKNKSAVKERDELSRQLTQYKQYASKKSNEVNNLKSKLSVYHERIAELESVKKILECDDTETERILNDETVSIDHLHELIITFKRQMQNLKQLNAEITKNGRHWQSQSQKAEVKINKLQEQLSIFKRVAEKRQSSSSNSQTIYIETQPGPSHHREDTCTVPTHKISHCELTAQGIARGIDFPREPHHCLCGFHRKTRTSPVSPEVKYKKLTAPKLKPHDADDYDGYGGHSNNPVVNVTLSPRIKRVKIVTCNVSKKPKLK